MQFWDELINTALLGTDKRPVTGMTLPGPLAAAAEAINGREGTDREEQFLQLASVALNFRQSGHIPLQGGDIHMTRAEEESLPYCSIQSLRLLKDILADEHTSLLHYWLLQCAAARRVVPPDWVPLLLNRAADRKLLRSPVMVVSGRRGEWLSRLNPAWQFSLAPREGEDIWQTGTAEQRKTFLRQLRQTDPSGARTLLIQSWPQENANGRTELLKQLSGTVIPEDQEWLMSLLTDKSQKVKDEARELLLQLPGSPVVLQHWETVRPAVILKKEKALLGMISKTTLYVEGAGSTDFQLLIGYIPPVYWEEHLGANPQTIIGFFQKGTDTGRYLSSLATAAVRFRDTRWALALAQHGELFHADLLELLPVKQQDEYCLSFFSQNVEAVIEHVRQREGEWSFELARTVLKHTARNPYHFNIHFYKENLLHIPRSIIMELAACAPPEDHLRAMWQGISEQIGKWVDLKQQTQIVFNG